MKFIKPEYYDRAYMLLAREGAFNGQLKSHHATDSLIMLTRVMTNLNPVQVQTDINYGNSLEDIK